MKDHLGIWIGDGLPAIPKRLYDQMINWEFVDLAELKPARVLESLHPEPDPQLPKIITPTAGSSTDHLL